MYRANVCGGGHKHSREGLAGVAWLLNPFVMLYNTGYWFHFFKLLFCISVNNAIKRAAAFSSLGISLTASS